MHGFEICKLPAYIAEDIQFEKPAIVSMEKEYFYNGSLKFVKKVENLKNEVNSCQQTFLKS